MKKITGVKKAEGKVLDSVSDKDYMNLFLEKYYSKLDIDPTVENSPENNKFCDVLVAYNILLHEMLQGGYMQLFNSGYGEFILEANFQSNLKIWGLMQMASNLEKAKKIYEKIDPELKLRPDLILNDDLEYLSIKFLDREFFAIVYDETIKINNYIKSNMNLFEEVA